MFANRTFLIASVALIAYALAFACIDGFLPGMILSKGTFVLGAWLMTLGLFVWAVRQLVRGSSPLKSWDDDEPPAAV